MREQGIAEGRTSRVVWDNLEEWARKKVQEFVQSLLEEEVTELVRRAQSERRKAVDSLPVYRNGYGKGRRLTLCCGPIRVRRPRVRGLEERFESRVLPLFARRSKRGIDGSISGCGTIVLDLSKVWGWRSSGRVRGLPQSQ